MTKMLDISQLSGDGETKVLSGKQRGLQARLDFGIDKLDDVEENIKVVLSSDIEAITPSFILGMFGASVRRYGSADRFLEKYRFNAPGHVMAQIRRGVDYSLVKGNPLPL